MSSREQFLRSISEALGRTDIPKAPLSEPPSAIGASSDLAQRAARVNELVSRSADNLLDIVARSAEASGWKVARVPDTGAAGDYILEVAREIEARSVVHSLHPAVREALSADPFARTGIESVAVTLDTSTDAASANADDIENRRAELRAIMAASELGITGVDYAIAETGTCVILSRAGASRLVSLLPPVHIALVERGQVLPSLDELFTLRRSSFTSGELGSYMNLITGPSRSADIEYTLITGVHGPGEVHMVLIG